METVATEWPINTYFRLARYLHLSGRYHEAIDWLQQLHDNVDATCDARETLYKEWGWMQACNKPATIPKLLRNNLRKLIKQEIALYNERQRKIDLKINKQEESQVKPRRTVARKNSAEKTQNNRLTVSPAIAVIRGADVGEILFHFAQHCFVGESSVEPLDMSAEDFVCTRITNGPLTVLEVHQLPPKYRRLLREISAQYIMFLEMNRSLPFPPDCLNDSSNEQLAPPLLQYINEHRWPFPQTLPSKQ